VNRPRRHSRRRGGILFKLAVLLAALLAAGALAWMLFLPLVVMREIRDRTGFDVSVASLSANAFTGRLIVRGLVLRNPRTFPSPDFVELREFDAEADVWTLFADRLVIDALTVDLRRIVLVRRADGRTNADLFQRGLLGESLSAPPKPAPVKPAAVSTVAVPIGPTPPAPPQRRWLVRRLKLRFDELVLADHTGAAPSVTSHRLGLDRSFTNVTDPAQLLAPDVLKRFAGADLGPGLAAFVPGRFGHELGDQLRDAAKTAADQLKDAARQTGIIFKGFIDKLEDSRKP